MAKKKASKNGLHQEVNQLWGWVVLTIGIAAIISIAAWYYYSL